MADIFCSDRQLADRYNVSKPTIWRWLKSNPDFPKPVRFSPGCTRWKIAEIEAYEARKVALPARRAAA